MAQINQNFTMWAGDNLNLVVAVTDALGNKVDLTSASIKWVLYKSVNSANAEVSKSTGAGITINSPSTDGKFTVALVPADTVALSGTFYHEAQVTDAVGNQITVLTGQATINQTHKK